MQPALSPVPSSLLDSANRIVNVPTGMSAHMQYNPIPDLDGLGVPLIFLFTARDWSHISAVAVKFVSQASWALAAVSEVEELFREELDATGLSHP